MDATRRMVLSAAATVATTAATGPVFAQNAAPAAPAADAPQPNLPIVTAPGYDAPSEVKSIFVRNLAALEEQAKKIVPNGGFGYISSGAGDEWTMHENMHAFKRVQLLPTYLEGNGAPDSKTSLLGIDIPVPIITTVFGGHAIAHVTAEAGTAYGTHAAGTIFTCGSQSNLTMEEVAKASPGPNFMQLYIQNDAGLMREFVQRARAAGYKAIVVTMDAFFRSNRETDLANHYSSPFQAVNFPKRAETGYNASSQVMKTTVDWKDIEFVQKESGLPVIVKGVLTEQMALDAVKQGCAGIQVSNHGGRQLDDTPATFTVLPEIADAVGGRIPIILDSGVRRGQDVYKALAMGANVIALGRPVLYGLALGGWMGVRDVHHKIADEFRMTMMATGTKKISEITRDRLRV